MPKHYFSFNRQNYLIILGGVFLVIVGFILMSGGGSEDPKVFDEAELFHSRRITIAPITVLLGYVVVIYGIMKRPAPDSTSKEHQDTIDR